MIELKMAFHVASLGITSLTYGTLEGGLPRVYSFVFVEASLHREAALAELAAKWALVRVHARMTLE